MEGRNIFADSREIVMYKNTLATWYLTGKRIFREDDRKPLLTPSAPFFFIHNCNTTDILRLTLLMHLVAISRAWKYHPTPTLPFSFQRTRFNKPGEAEVGHALYVLFVGAAAMVTVAGFVTAGMLLTIVRCGRGILISSYATFTALMGALALLAVFVHPAAGVFPAIMCAAGIFIICRRRNWIAFSGANLKVGSILPVQKSPTQPSASAANTTPPLCLALVPRR